MAFTLKLPMWCTNATSELKVRATSQVPHKYTQRNTALIKLEIVFKSEENAVSHKIRNSPALSVAAKSAAVEQGFALYELYTNELLMF